MNNLKNIQITLFTILTSIIGITSLQANVSLPKIFGDHMVLQRKLEIPVWGWAEAGEKVVVNLNGTKKNTKTDENGKWMVKLPAMEAGGPYTMTISGKNKIEFKDILIGDVWICSGQSNMEWPLNQTINGKKFIKNSANEKIRILNVNNTISVKPLEDIETVGWQPCNPETIGGFSAVGYYFGYFLNKELDIPIGLIGSNWGGTMIESWTSSESCQENEFLKEWFDKLKELDMDMLLTKEKEKIKLYKTEMEKVNSEEIHPFAMEGFDYSKWKTIDLPSLWENTEVGDFDGIVWMRRSFIVPDDFDTKDAVLYIGKIDDTDITWINGKVVGETYNDYRRQRMYKIPEDVLKPGKNEIVVRIEDYVGGGGIYGDANLMNISGSNSEIFLAGSWKYKLDETPLVKNLEHPEANLLSPNHYPTLLFNGMINPLIPYGIKGAIWYQGEANADRMEQSLMYHELMDNMIIDWRKHWNEGDFPFFMVQLANFRASDKEPTNHPWAYLREAQYQSTQTLPNVGMACIIDIGEADDIHPRNKKDVGYRLSLSALKITYNKDIVYTGPIFNSAKFDGNKAKITFGQTGKGLVVKNKYGYINGFAVAGSDKKFYYAMAKKISNNTIEITSDNVSDIKAIRYAWAINPDDVNLYNSEDLPAVPFRTDNW